MVAIMITPSFHYTLNSNHREKETFLFVIAVQSPSCVQLFKMPWTAACQVSLSLIISWSGSLPFHWPLLCPGEGACLTQWSRATQDGQFIVKSYGKTWSTGGENGKPLQYTYHEKPMNCIKRQKKKKKNIFLLLLLLSHFSHVRLCATP